jgi:glycosyltransferase involved in cell wall biosynthesis
LVIDKKLINNIIFVWSPDEKERYSYYKQSLWVVSPLLYRIFPFSLSFALRYNCPILASESDENKEIFGNEIEYFIPTSQQDMINKMKYFIKHKKNYAYTDILKKYKSEVFISDLLKIIKE